MMVVIPIFIAVCIVAWVLRPQKGTPGPRKYAILAVPLLSLVLAAAAIIFQLLQNAHGKIEVSNISKSLTVAGLSAIAAAALAVARNELYVVFTAGVTGILPRNRGIFNNENTVQNN